MFCFYSIMEMLKNTKRILHFIVFATCLFISGYQLAACLQKLKEPPVSTHYKFAINDSLNYPAVTICRNPPYKYNVLKYYNLGDQNSSIEHTSEWQNFPFERNTLQELWDNATYRKDEVIKLYGLHGESANAEVKQYYYFYHGRCFTFLPRISATQPWPNSGWAILLQHIDRNPEETYKPKRIGLATESYVNGFHVFVHEVREPFTENIAQTKYQLQYFYVEVGEEIEVKINVDEFKGISTNRRPCLNDINYSQYKCIEQRWWNNISQAAGCTVPWMRDVIGLPHCNKYQQFLKLLQTYINFTDVNDPSCPLHPCNVTAYKLQVLKRHPLQAPFSQLYVYFTSKMVSVMQELPGYDANTFLADLGGSLGFFLGLSVLGILGVLEKTWVTVRCLAREKKGEEEKDENVEKGEKL